MDARFYAFEHQEKNDVPWTIANGRFTTLIDCAYAAGQYLAIQAQQDKYPAVKLIPIE